MHWKQPAVTVRNIYATLHHVSLWASEANVSVLAAATSGSGLQTKLRHDIVLVASKLFSW